jgi:polar amino acid transport system substrate-binding protein
VVVGPRGEKVQRQSLPVAGHRPFHVLFAAVDRAAAGDLAAARGLGDRPVHGQVIQVQAEKCKTDGKDPIEVQSFTDQPSSILAVRSKRSDAFFSSQAPLTYFVSQAKGQLELTGVGQKNGFEALYQGAVVPKGSPLSAVLRDAVKLLMDNGTYAAIMKKWGLENNMIKEPGINLGGTLPK